MSRSVVVNSRTARQKGSSSHMNFVDGLERAENCFRSAWEAAAALVACAKQVSRSKSGMTLRVGSSESPFIVPVTADLCSFAVIYRYTSMDVKRIA